MNGFFLRKLMLLPALLALAACGVMDPAAIPSPPPQASVTPAATSVRPRPTSAPTAAPSTVPATGDSTAIEAALAKSKSATTYRMQFTEIVPLEMPFAPPDQVGTVGVLADYSGAFNGKEAHWVSKGAAFHAYEVDPVKGYEVMLVADQAYLRGPFSPLEAIEERWYSVDYDSIAPVVLGASQMLDWLLNVGVHLAEFTATGSEMLDEQQCAVYRAGQSVTLNVLNGLALSTEPITSRQAELRFADVQIQQTETALWICADGYLHQVKTQLTGMGKAEPSQQVTYDVLLHMYDFNGNIEIVAPADIRMLPLAGGPSVELFPGDSPTATVYNGGNVREWPVDGKPLDQINAGETVQLLSRNPDGAWYRIVNIRGVIGWVSVTLLTIEPIDADAIPIDQPSILQPLGDFTATVYNGGNVRERPVDGQPLDQINAGETVKLLERNRDGTWLKIVNIRSVTGWVSRTLLTIDPEVARQVPIVEP